jgi:hypothetical protein
VDSREEEKMLKSREQGSEGTGVREKRSENREKR